MLQLVLFFMYLSQLSGIHDERGSRDLEQAWEDLGPIQQRKFLLYVPEQVRMSTQQCNPQVEDCSGADMGDLASSPIQQTQESCTDIQPQGSLECFEYAQYDLCESLPKEYCSNSCGFCCFDEQPSDFVGCDEVIQKELCEVVVQDGKCKESCGVCSQGQQADTEGLDATGFLEAISEYTELASFMDAVSVSSLEYVINTSEKFTIFAPTNDAFRAAFTVLAIDARQFINDVDLLNIVLEYHVIKQQKILSSELKDSLGLESEAAGQNPLIVRNSDNLISIIGYASTGKVTTADIKVGEIIVHIVDAVLIPKL